MISNVRSKNKWVKLYEIGVIFVMKKEPKSIPTLLTQSQMEIEKNQTCDNDKRHPKSCKVNNER